ncbi:MAG: cob(I)yrinic acid a,c-diamide adenosyltransferase [Actinobacteria bacterium]|nr:cob(I)yrinic acid a,c-diamide adenosyltransferase [Actinomycetota bacterium]
MTDEHQPPRDAPPKGTTRVPSLILVNTGDGKGKSTAAFGTAMRAMARGWRVAVIQFLKSGEWSVGEEKIGRRIGFDWWALGDGFTWDSEDMEQSEAVARAAWGHARSTIESGEYELVLLDEITYPVNWGWVELEELLRVLRGRPEHVNVILTGRDAPEGLVELADTVTEMKKVKHAYERGVKARRGIDY